MSGFLTYLLTVCAIKSCLGGASKCSSPPYFCNILSLADVLESSLRLTTSLLNSSSFVGSACMWTSVPCS